MVDIAAKVRWNGYMAGLGFILCAAWPLEVWVVEVGDQGADQVA